MTFQNIRIRNDCGIVTEEGGFLRQVTNCAIHLDEQQSRDVQDYVDRFGLRGMTVDAVLSMIFRMGLREMKAQTDLDRYLDEQDEQPMDKVKA